MKLLQQRVVGCWNSLPQEVIDADTVNSYKSRYDLSSDRQHQIWDNKLMLSPMTVKFTLS